MTDLTKDDVNQIFYAISVAEGEVGNEFQRLRAKLYAIFPEVKLEHELTERALKLESKKQQDARKEITEEFLRTINRNSPILEQLISWYIPHEKDVRSHYSDEICFPFDLWKYGDANLVIKLAGETRTELIEHGTDFDKTYAKYSDKEIVHGLIRILERKLWEEKRRKV